MKPMAPMQLSNDVWWPRDLGQPNSSGSQNDMRYAYFGDKHRLVVDAGGQVKTYDTGSYRIQGFGQQQRQGSSLTFASDQGPVDLGSLQVVS